ncbi:hypothetical protein ACUJ46_00885 [Sandaracinobacteroides sp. A072]|uniref:hypothetical protein n=1 Tax=Sandaracinobacteroides sp. A072 TaxID=3461146 RepID=UPI00404142D5
MTPQAIAECMAATCKHVNLLPSFDDRKLDSDPGEDLESYEFLTIFLMLDKYVPEGTWLSFQIAWPHIWSDAGVLYQGSQRRCS